MKRAIILKYLFVKNLATPPLEDIEGVMSRWTPEEKTEFALEMERTLKRNVDSLKAGGLWSDVEVGEQIFLKAGIYEVSERQRIDAAWLGESLTCLLWALKFVPELPPYDLEAGPDLVNALPPSPIKDLVKSASLRPDDAIKRQRNIAELWHWRARTHRLQEEGHIFNLPDGYTIEQIIELAALKGAEQGDLPEPIERDFAVLGKPYRDISSNEFAMLTSIVLERHKALNWLCGFSHSGLWADTSTNT